MKLELLKGLDPEQKAQRKAILYGCANGFEIVEDVLREKVATLFRASLERREYDSPSWALEQADAVGYIRALHEVIELLALDREQK